MSDPFHPYAHLFTDPQGPGDKRPTALQVVDDNGARDAWAGRVVLVTGGTSGIGVETVRALHATGADVYFTARDLSKGAATKTSIIEKSTGKGRLEIVEMNMDSLASVRKAAEDFLIKSNRRLNVLVNNAGIMATPFSKTEDGHERQFGVNHLAHFLLTHLLLPTLLSSSSPAFCSRVINVSSSAHCITPYVFDNDKPYDPWQAYGMSKTANIWMANYMDRVYGPRGVHAYSLHPGGIMTGLQVFTSQDMMDKWTKDEKLAKQFKNAEQGAATSVWAAVGTVWEGKGGKFLNDCGVAPPAGPDGGLMTGAAASWAYMPDNEDRLWALSSVLLGVVEDVQG